MAFAFELAFPLPATGEIDWDDQLQLAINAEQAGYDAVYAPETWGREAFGRLGYLASRTDEVELTASIISVHSRSPTLIAQAAATLDELSDGRAALGLGLSSPRLIEAWHGVEFEPALRRQREVIEIVRLALSGESVDYDGRVFDLDHFHLRFSPPRPRVPIYVGAQGPTNVELAGGFADGWMPNRIPLSAIPKLQEHLRRGAEKQDRNPEDVATMPYVATCILDDGRQARDRCREQIAFYVGAMGEYHYRAIANHGFEETADEIRQRWQEGDHDAARRAVSDELLNEITISGTLDEAIGLFEAYEGVADTVVTLPPTSANADEMRETIEHVRKLQT